MQVFLVGEDPVTKAIAKRLMIEIPTFLQPGMELPARGSEIQQKFHQYRKLAASSPVLLITDLDDKNCPIELRNAWLDGQEAPEQLMFRICVDEAESWLMADREGLAKYLSIDQRFFPIASQIDPRNSDNQEIRLPYKPSLYLMRELVPNSTDMEIQRKLTPKKLAKKGPEYNSVLVPFIHREWNIETAAKHSYSLRKAIAHIRRLDKHLSREK
jgi:hypothetical protein